MTRRRGKGEGHIRRITLASGAKAWSGWLTVGYKPDGKPIRRTAQRATKAEVQDALELLRIKYRADIDLEAEKTVRLGALLERWLEHYKATESHKRRTPATYTWAIERAKAAIGNPLAADVTPLQLQNAIIGLGAELKPKSLNLVRVVLKGAFRQAQLWRIRTDNPADGLKLPRASEDDADDRRIVGTSDAQQLLLALAGERLGLAVALTYAIGVRPGEAAALRRADVDLEAGTVTITATHNVVDGAVVREKTKSRRGMRTLPYPPEIGPWLTQQIARAQNERLVMGARWSAPDEGLLFVRESDGGRLSNHQLYAVARRVADKLGMGKLGPRILRRSMLSALAAAGIDAKVRAAIGGHTKEVTDAHYREVDTSEIDAAMGQMARILGPLNLAEGDEKSC